MKYIKAGFGFTVGYDFARAAVDTPIEVDPAGYAEPGHVTGWIAGDPGSKLGAQSHFDFHLAIARAGGFGSLADELQRVWFRRLMRLNWLKATQYRPVPADWHEQLVDAIASRDVQRAEDHMRQHAQFGSEDDRKALEQFQAQQA